MESTKELDDLSKAEMRAALAWTLKQVWDGTWYVECNNPDCGCKINDFPTKAEAVKAWNRRC